VREAVGLIEYRLLFLVKTKYRRAIVTAQSNRGLAHVDFLPMAVVPGLRGAGRIMNYIHYTTSWRCQ
jgi:hypothetical protein